jgi:Protein phosphatase 2C
VGVGHCPKADGRPAEDRGLATDRVVVAADGITRFPAPGRPYPSPSPGAIAAQIILEEVAQAAVRGGTPIGWLQNANNRIEQSNDRADAWARFSHHGDDVASAVAAVATTATSGISFAYIGDAGIAVLGADGKVSRITADDIQPIRRHFPPRSMPPHERMASMIDAFRNRSDGSGYGALTGERAAERYIRCGVWRLRRDDTAVVAFSDGARPMLETADFGSEILQCRHSAELSAALRNFADRLRLDDEATLAVLRIR